MATYNKKKKKVYQNPYVRILTLLLFLVILISIIAIAVNFIYSKMFSDNPRFRIRDIVVTSSGYWNNRSEEAAEILKIKRGVTNLYSLRLYKLRRVLEDMRGKGIAFAEVTKELPDTLKIKIIQRIPQAILYNRRSGMVVDKDAVVMDSSYFYKDSIDSLPVITGFKLNADGKPIFGETLEIVQPALILISLVNQYFPDMDIRVINLYTPDSLIVFMPGYSGKMTKIILPFAFSVNPLSTNAEIAESKTLLKTKLENLQELLRYLKWKGTKYEEINLVYKDQAVVK